MAKIVCFGPGPKFKGGISNYNTSLAKTLDKDPDNEVHIVSWTNQYPSIIPREFVDKSSQSDFLEGTRIKVKYITNYNNPFSWKETAKYIKSLKPDKVIFQWAISIQGIPMGSISKWLKKHCRAEIIFDLHFVVQKEDSTIDERLTKRGIKHADTYITHAYKTVDELKALYPNRDFTVNETGERSESEATTVIKLFHPVYDLYEPDPDFDTEAFKKELGLKKHVFLFFGFIRKYKGLHNAIRAFKQVADQRDDVSLLICGEEFWATLDTSKITTKIKRGLFAVAQKLFLKNKESEQDYRPLQLIEELGLEESTVVKNEFIPNEDVNKYFQVSDCSVLYYLTATPSGVESLTYNFELPILATNVGHFPETIKDGFNGYLAEDGNIDSMAEQMLKFIEHPLPAENVRKSAENMSWENYVTAILKDLPK
ncbi:glycosyltransferase [Gracilimonas sediminicola]|uniref:Glycosyltransferase n=1 Tax=Gracilimonas sediminicola TaxID=2952158 RepID=A0A9X2RHD4_9BACT|nr:glycosyltransferase [Gracilimonas sediminicola]MCP9292198.1 glycosyltransferase [Gracilimonas sediminicola]